MPKKLGVITRRLIVVGLLVVGGNTTISNASEGFKVSDLIPAVVFLECHDAANTIEQHGTGSSVYTDDGEHLILTNAHVLRPSNGGQLGTCYIMFPTTEGLMYDSAYEAKEAIFYDKTEISIEGIEVSGADLAVLTVGNPAKEEDGTTYPAAETRRFPDILEMTRLSCPEPRAPEIGEKLFVLGYPAIGGAGITITEGILSGFDGELNELIKTSAKIDQGNSGGIAVAAQDGCLIGIPTLSVSGELESMARIIRLDMLLEFLKHEGSSD